MLTTGTRLGAYEILNLLGAGGMGEVYRARDTRLDRPVALKVLPEGATHDPERRSRFEREARAIAGLSHPHICTLHDVGHDRGLDYLVMELIEGRTLADHLQGGPLAAEVAVSCAMQIADALSAAHRQGIVHRDLKPANIMLTTTGGGSSGRIRAKLLDFGVAQLRTPPGSAETMTAPATFTREGGVVGTLPYMAPEQLEGRPHDERVDIFAFGAILFEMLTGRRAFDGGSAAGVVAAVLHDIPPPLRAERPELPVVVEQVVATCLAKDPDDRWSSMHDVGMLLRASAAGAWTPPAPVPGRPRRPGAVWLIVLLLGLGTAALWTTRLGRTPVAQPIRDVLSMLPPPGATPSYAWEAPQVSPDGRHVAFAASDPQGTVWLYVRSREAPEPRRLAGTEEAGLPFWSPDSTRLGFFAAGQLKTVALDGGAARVLAPAPVARGGAWGRDDVIVYSAIPNAPPMLIPSTGGEPRPAPVKQRERGFRSFPQLLPDGRHYVYQALDPTMGGPNGLYVASLDDTEFHQVVRTRSHGVVVNDQLLYLQDTALVAHAFDTATGQVRGTPRTIAEHVGFNAITYQGLFSVSPGVVAYLGATRGAQLIWFDRQGRALASLTPPGDYSSLCLTARDRGVVFEQADPQTGTVDLWHLDLTTRQPTRLTFDPAVDFYPVCAPASHDGAAAVFASLRSGPPSLFRLPIGAPGSEQPVLLSFAAKIPTDWTADGRTIVYSVLSETTSWDIATVPAAGGEPRLVVNSPADERGGRVSPDGRWLAYTAREGGGRYQIYVEPYPPGGAKWQVSRSGGMQPVWRKDSRELYYVSPERTLMAVTTSTAGVDFRFGEPTPLMAARTAGWEGGNAMGAQYAAAIDGQRFLVSTAAEASPITVVLNWAGTQVR